MQDFSVSSQRLDAPPPPKELRNWLNLLENTFCTLLH